MSDPRSARLQPLDSRSHITRINDWVGSDTFVEGSRRDPGDTPMPEGKTARYMLKNMAFDGTRRLAPGTIVELTPGQVGPHHAQLPDENYDKTHVAAFEAMNEPRGTLRVEEVIPLEHHTKAVAKLSQALADRDTEVAALKKKLADETSRADLLASTVKAVDEATTEKK